MTFKKDSGPGRGVSEFELKELESELEEAELLRVDKVGEGESGC